MHTLFLIFKYSPHLESAWLCTSILALGAAGITLDLTTIALSLIALVSTALTTYFTYLMAKTKAASLETATVVKQTSTKVVELETNINSKMTLLLEAIEKKAFAEGHLAGGTEEKVRRAIQDSDRAKGAQSEKDATAHKANEQVPKL